MKFTLMQKLSVGLLSLAMLMTVVRLIRGPSNADRIIALDLLAIIIVAVISIVSVIFNETVYLDIATSLAIVAFIGTVAYSRFLLEKKVEMDRDQTKELS